MTVYERLGGDTAIAALLEGLYSRGLADPLLAPLLAGIDTERLKAHQFAFLSQVFGGPVQYSVPDLAQAHARLAIEERHFDAFMRHVESALQEIGAPEDLRAELVANVGNLGSVIVNTPTPVPAGNN
jgi:hemoglobin